MQKIFFVKNGDFSERSGNDYSVSFYLSSGYTIKFLIPIYNSSEGCIYTYIVLER